MNEADKIVHVSRMQQELLFQLLVKNKAFKNVPVGELKDFCTTSVAQLRNYEYRFEQNPPEKLFDDEKYNQSTFVTDHLMAGVKKQ